MKKMVMIALAALLVVVVGVAAALSVQSMKEEPVDAQAVVTDGEEEQVQEVYELSGEILELGEGFLLLQDAVQGEVQVNLSEDTLFEGAELDELAAGQFVLVLYNGMMTRSLPPQVTALKVGVYAITGEVTGAEEGSFTLLRDEIGDEVIVFLSEGGEAPAEGERVTVYTNGAMTMSLPAQTTALGVVRQ